MKAKVYTLKDFSDFVDSHIVLHQKTGEVGISIASDYLIIFDYAKVAIELFKHEAQENEIAAISKGFIT